MSGSVPSVCIVGAGAAGLPLALGLADRQWRVTIVEGGGATPADSLEDTYRVRVTGVPHRGVHAGRFRALGGSTTRWGGQLWPWEAHEFEPRPALGIAGWPIGYEEIRGWYAKAFALLGMKHPTLSPGEAAARGVTLPPLDGGDFALKYSTWMPWARRNLGRTIGARLRSMPNVTLLLQTTAVRIEMDGTGRRAVGVRIRSGDGESLIAADVVVVAGGALESTRLLFASGALGNGSDWLGRAFMDHLSVRIGRFVPRDLRAFNRMFAPVFVGGVQFTPRMVLRPSVLERERLLSAYGHWDTELPAHSGLAVIRAKLRAWQSGHAAGIALADVRAMAAGARDVLSLVRGRAIDRRRYFPGEAAIHLRVDTEQLPDHGSRVTAVGGGELDSFGLPRMSLDWHVSDAERDTVRRTAALLAAELERHGVGELSGGGDPFAADRDWGELRGDSFHMMGGTRMAKTPAEGVVDANARVFGTDNLYIAGASTFPTGGMANPTLTLIALSMRLAAHLATTR